MADTLLLQLPEVPSADRCQLVVIEGPDMGRALQLGAKELIVGTGGDTAMKLRDGHVSDRHFAIRVLGNAFEVKDLSSTNGTWFEGSRVGTVLVPVGATLKVGETFLRVMPQPEPVSLAPSRARRFGELVAESLSMREVFAVLELAAKSDATVLVQGETGTGKELVARALHDASPRRNKPFVAVDCGALPETLLESELFGHVKGAFTGADRQREGAFVRAHGGTLFLDELGSISAPAQARLLRAIEERKIRPVGADSERAVDVRLIAASGIGLETRVAEGAFRPDLFYRLAVLQVTLPPLRNRREDIKPIIGELLRRRGFVDTTVEGPNLQKLLAHGWSGNVRELRNVIDRAVALSPGIVSFAQLKLQLAQTEPSGVPVRLELPFKEAKEAVVRAFEHEYVRAIHERAQGNVSKGAREAQVDRKHWRNLLREHGVQPGPEEDE